MALVHWQPPISLCHVVSTGWSHKLAAPLVSQWCHWLNSSYIPQYGFFYCTWVSTPLTRDSAGINPSPFHRHPIHHLTFSGRKAFKTSSVMEEPPMHKPPSAGCTPRKRLAAWRKWPNSGNSSYIRHPPSICPLANRTFIITPIISLSPQMHRLRLKEKKQEPAFHE